MANLNWFQMLLKKLDMSGKVGLAKKKKKKKNFAKYHFYFTNFLRPSF
jgi:hypothetical protein